MGLLSGNEPRGLLAQRGGAFVFVTALHVAVVAVLVNMHYGERVELVTPSIKVVNFSLEQPALAPAPEIPVVLEPPPMDVVVPLVDVQIMAPPPTAITAPPPRPAQARQVVLRDEGPVMLGVDEVNYLHQPPLRYPVQAKRARMQGTAWVRVLIGPDGEPREARIDRSSGHKMLDEAAREWVLKVQFRPHRENGATRAAVAIVPVVFELNSRNS
jgi:protein TonB